MKSACFIVLLLSHMLPMATGLLCDFKTCKKKTVIDSDIICTAQTVCTGSTLDSSTFVTCDGIKSCIRAEGITAADAVTCSNTTSCSAVQQQIISETSNIYCSGLKSCLKSTLLTQQGDIYCDGTQSCSNAMLDSSNDVICNSTTACQRVASIAASGNVQCIVEKTCSRSIGIITTTQGDINCVAEKSCQKSNLLSEGDITCGDSNACQEANIVSNNGDINCVMGSKTCYQAENILALNGNIMCTGSQSCQNVVGRIYAKKLITVGSSAANGAVIESDGDIKCSGSKSCKQSVLTAGNDIYFSSQWAAKENTIATAGNTIGCAYPPSSNPFNLLLEKDLFEFDDNGIIVSDSFKGFCQDSTFTSDTAYMASAYSVKIYANNIIQQYCWNCRYYPNGGDLNVDFTGYATGDVKYFTDPRSVYIHCADIICTINCVAGSVAAGACKTVVIYYNQLSTVHLSPAECHGNTEYAKKLQNGIYCPEFRLMSTNEEAVSNILEFNMMVNNEGNGINRYDTFKGYLLILSIITCICIVFSFIGYVCYNKNTKGTEYESLV